MARRVWFDEAETDRSFSRCVYLPIRDPNAAFYHFMAKVVRKEANKENSRMRHEPRARYRTNAYRYLTDDYFYGFSFYYDASTHRTLVRMRSEIRPQVQQIIEALLEANTPPCPYGWQKGYHQIWRWGSYQRIKELFGRFESDPLRQKGVKRMGYTPLIKQFFSRHRVLRHRVNQVLGQIVVAMYRLEHGDSSLEKDTSLARSIAYYESGACDRWLQLKEQEEIDRDVKTIRQSVSFDDEQQVPGETGEEWVVDWVLCEGRRNVAGIHRDGQSLCVIVSGIESPVVGQTLFGAIRIQRAQMMENDKKCPIKPTQAQQRTWITTKAIVCETKTGCDFLCDIENMGRTLVRFLHTVKADATNEMMLCGELVFAKSKSTVQDFYKYEGKRIKITLTDGRVVEGECEGYTRAPDNEPEIASIDIWDEYGDLLEVYETEIASIAVVDET